ncbi:hypothetical protein VM1G_04868 [Cytospora mali]|uniref:Uncharacterized protein n=1 Tax=Cytospora mali TaxID=578113 RepID=A0A194W0D3_CYTMA|nr:hypothetical protein VM1G_04868 [Valsa mali]
MSYYCANYYSFINCQNIVSRFGERCDLCLVLKSGASLSDGILPDETSSSHSSHAVEAPRKQHHRKHHNRSSGTLRVDSRYEK